MTYPALFFRSLLFCSLLFLIVCSRAYGQPYVCTDVSPDLVSTGNASADIDLNNDAVIDFRLMGISIPSVNLVIAQASQIGLGNSVLSDGSGNALALAFGTSIGSTSAVWHQMNSGNLDMLLINNGTGSGTWLGATDQYLGLQLAVGTNTFYGWAHLSFSSSVNTYTLMDYTYDSIPNRAIAAGVGCASIKTPLFVMSNTVCSTVSTTLTANTGTQSPTTYAWISTPAGAIFSAPSSSATTVSFTNAGIYNITLVAISGTVFGTTTDTVKAYPGPFVTLLSSSPSICPGQQFTLTAFSLLADTSYTFLSPSGATVSSAYLPVIGLSNPCTYTVWATLLGCLTQDTLTVGETSFTPTLSSSSTSVCAGSSVTLNSNGGGSIYSYTFCTINGLLTNTFICGSCAATQVVEPTISTRYIVIASNSNYCTDSTSLFIKVLPHSPITAAASSTVICPGTLTYLYPVGSGTSSAVSYTWAGGGLVLISPGSTATTVGVTPYINSIYTVSIVDANGCIDTSSIQIKIDSTLTLPMQVSVSSSVICTGGSATLVATSSVNPIVNVTYSWISLAGPTLTGSTVVVSPTASTTYSVMGTDNVGCNAYSEVTIITSICDVGIEKHGSADSELSVYPNPTHDRLLIHCGTSRHVVIELLDPLGKCILKEDYIFSENNSDYALDVLSIPSGVYFIKLSADHQQVRVIRVVKE